MATRTASASARATSGRRSRSRRRAALATPAVGRIHAHPGLVDLGRWPSGRTRRSPSNGNVSHSVIGGSGSGPRRRRPRGPRVQVVVRLRHDREASGGLGWMGIGRLDRARSRPGGRTARSAAGRGRPDKAAADAGVHEVDMPSGVSYADAASVSARCSRPSDRDRATWERRADAVDDAASPGGALRRDRLTGIRAARGWQDLDTVPLYEHMIVTGAWWDYVDELAIRARRADPAEPIGPLSRSVLRRGRSTTTCGGGGRRSSPRSGPRQPPTSTCSTDAIDANLDGRSRDFFIRKGIGWALREHAKTDPAWVRGYVDDQVGPAVAVVLREALKHLGG